MITESPATRQTRRRPQNVPPNERQHRSAEPQKQERALGHMLISIKDIAEKIGEDPGPGCFVVVLDGDCLEPLVFHGAQALVAPAMPIRAGDLVLLWPKQTGQQPKVKRVVTCPTTGWETWHPDSEVEPVIIVEQLKPPRQFAIRTTLLSAIQRVALTFSPDTYQRASRGGPVCDHATAAGARS